MSLPDPLRFTVSLIDQITAPIADIRRQFSGLTQDYQNGVTNMMAGAAGMVGAGFALHAALAPAIELQSALSNISALGVADDSIRAITETALNFSTQYGQSVVDVVNHTEMLIGNFGHMSNEVLANTTKTSSLLAMALKTDAATVNDYFKILHGNNTDLARSMGNDAFIAQISEMAVISNKMYGLKMEDLSGMVGGMHTLTSNMGVAIPEQIAVLSFLTSKVEAGDAEAYYTNFLEAAPGIEDALKVSLLDNKGALLPMPEILDILAPLLDGGAGAANWSLLDSAGLGDGSLMIMSMLKDRDKFDAGFDALNKVDGLNLTLEMATKLTSQWQRLESATFNVRAAFGSALLPAILPLVESLGNGAASLTSWTQEFPNITRVIGYGTLALIGFVAINGAATLALGIGGQALASYGIIAGTIKFAIAGLTAGFAFLRTAIFASNATLALSPVGAAIAVFAGLSAGIAAVIYYWEDLKRMMGSGWNFVTSGISDTVNGAMQFMGFDNDEPIGTTINAVQQTRPKHAIQPGGIMQQMSNMNSKTTNMGGVSIYPTYMANPNDFASEMEMVAG